MTEHPLHSDKDNYIRNLEARIEELEEQNCILEKANENLSCHKNKERKRKLAKAFKVLLLLAIVSPFVTGGGYWVYTCDADWDRLHERCSKLCELVIGDLSLRGYFSTDQGCKDDQMYCLCKTRLGREINLPRTPRRELEGDLSEIVQKMDVATWKYCMNVKGRASKEFFSELECSHIPWIVNLNVKAEQDRMDGGNR